MNKLKFLLPLFLVLLVISSCSKKISLSGTIKNAAPNSRIEISDESGVGHLPIINVGLDNTGKFNTEFEAPRDGMYIISLNGKTTFVYLKQGQNLSFTADATTFPEKITFTGDAKNNNEFLSATREFFVKYSSGINLKDVLQKPEQSFISELKKIQSDLEKNINTNAAKYKADEAVKQYSLIDLQSTFLTVIAQYNMQKNILAGGVGTMSPALTAYEKALDKDPDAYMKSHSSYRNYRLQKLMPEFQKYAEKLPAEQQKDVLTVFKNFLATKKDISSTIKDYLLAFVVTNTGLGSASTDENFAQAKKIIQEDIKDESIKQDLTKLFVVVKGPEKNKALALKDLQDKNGKAATIATNNKPTLVLFYTGWAPGVKEQIVPVAKQAANFMQNKVNYAFVSFDDNVNAFKASTKLFDGIAGNHYWVSSGINGATAKDLGIYSFKLPSYIVLDAKGNVISNMASSLNDVPLIQSIEKATGLQLLQPAPQQTAPGTMPVQGQDSQQNVEPQPNTTAQPKTGAAE